MTYTTSLAAMVSQQLSRNALAACRHYLPAGRREGQYWMVGNVAGDPGRSLYVRLIDSNRGKAGKWVDAATGEHGDLLDLICLNQHCRGIGDAIREAQRFLGLPSHSPSEPSPELRPSKVQPGSTAAARRLFAAARPLTGTLAAHYLQARGITRANGLEALRFHPRCYYRPSSNDAIGIARDYPALVCAVTDDAGRQTGVHRTWLDPDGTSKAAVASPRRSLGNIAGHAIRIGVQEDIMVAGEGLETMLSLREALPALPVLAATSSAHLAAISFPPQTVRLYVARDGDAAGDAAFAALSRRARSAGIETIALIPQLGDFNDDLLAAGHHQLALDLLDQLHPADRQRFAIR